MAAALKAAIRSIDSEQPVSKLAGMEENLGSILATERFSALLSGLMAALGLLLAAFGLYGVLSLAIVRRTGEIGLRMALGAQRGDILKLVIGQGMKPVLIGLACGLLGSLALTRAMAGLLLSWSRARLPGVPHPRLARSARALQPGASWLRAEERPSAAQQTEAQVKGREATSEMASAT